MWVRITGLGQNAEAVILYWVTVKQGEVIVHAYASKTPDKLIGELLRGILGRGAKRVMPQDAEFLDSLQYQYRSPYFMAHAPEIRLDGRQFADAEFRSSLIQPLPPQAHRGSKPRCHLLTHGSPEEVAARLTDLIEPFGEVSPNDKWMPHGVDDQAEARLDQAPQLLDSKICADLKSWWLAVASPRAMTPSWDIATTCTINGRKGILLVEAKAHVEELCAEAGGKRLNGMASPNSRRNHERIQRCMDEANCSLKRETNLRWQLSRDCHYQMSNRFAWAWKLTALGMPVILVYLGFLNAVEMKDRGEPFFDGAHWQEIVKAHSECLFPAEVWDSRWLVNSQCLVPLLRVVECPLA